MAKLLFNLLGVLIVIVLLPLILIALPIAWMMDGARGHALRRAFLRRWGCEGRYVLFVHSNSPNWEEYLAANILPRLKGRSVLLNWSERSKWPKNTLEVRIFRHWCGDREFNPMAIVIAPGRKVETVRFWQAFRDFKHGKTQSLKEREAELDAILSQLPSPVAAAKG